MKRRISVTCWLIIGFLFPAFQPVDVEAETKEVISSVSFSSDEINAIYRRFEWMGLHPGDPQSASDEKFRELLKKFQKVAKLEPTGLIDKATWEKFATAYDPEGYTLRSFDQLMAESKPKTVIVEKHKPTPRIQNPKGDPEIENLLSDLFLFYLQNLIPGKHYETPEAKTLIQEKVSGLVSSCDSSGCAISFTLLPCFPGSRGDSATANQPTELIELPGKDSEQVLTMMVQYYLNSMGYNCGKIDGLLGNKTLTALNRFETDNGLINRQILSFETLSQLILSIRHPVRFSLFVKTTNKKFGATDGFFEEIIQQNPPQKIIKQPLHSNVPGKPAKDIFRIIEKLDFLPISLHDAVYVVESVDCSYLSGDWVVLYEGTVEAVADDFYEVKLVKRISYRYHPEAEGYNDSDWWCIPRRRHCYSEIEFSDWNGKFKKDQVVPFEKSKVFNKKMTLINGALIYIKNECGR